ncbi:hypothetical protein [Streptomyces qinzhouensis]|uniref:DUF8094 domain-containing protein n=1 Tax=Streptomyces qinzhouensis TaxID=2599401 RepID=A0A5B8JGD5_9ACTN|nr:hypothetical protein [Streptomyces qinzhouensis]QDY76810.1 hypothetical protein FQU76_10015 [Streptomyces qinzhouensis]
MTRPFARLGTAGLVLLTALATGCSAAAVSTDSTGSTDNGAGASSAAPGPLVLRAQEAREIFQDYADTKAAADAALDEASIRMVQTGPLLAESLARYEIARKAGTALPLAGYRKPTFLIPDGPGGQEYPRWFTSFSKREGRETDRASEVHYFVQERPGSPWRAAVGGSALTGPEPAPPLPPSVQYPEFAAPLPDPRYPQDAVRPGTPLLPELDRAADGAIRMSGTPAADREVCDTLAASLTTSVPGEPAPAAVAADRRFESGPFTTGLRSYAVGLSGDGLLRDYTYRATDAGLPVFRLASGDSLVMCTLTRDHRVSAPGTDGTVAFTAGSDTDVLLNGGRSFRRVDQRGSVHALVALPASKGEPATVLSSNGYDPQILSATGVR